MLTLLVAIHVSLEKGTQAKQARRHQKSSNSMVTYSELYDSLNKFWTYRFKNLNLEKKILEAVILETLVCPLDDR